MTVAEQVRGFLEELGAFLEEKSIVKDVADRPPRELHIEMTYKCNSSCVMCNIEKLKEKQKLGDLNFSDIRGAIENSLLLEDLKYVILSGGEPWLNPDIIDTAVYLLSKFPDANLLILSNLTEPELVLPGIRQIKNRAGLERVSIGSSLDGVGKTHDKIRGKSGAFDLTVATALMVGEKYPGLLPSFNFTLIPRNAGSIYELYKWAEKNFFSLSYQAAVPKKEIENEQWTPGKVEIVNIEINKIIDDIWKKEDWSFFETQQLFDNLKLLFFLLNFNYIYKYIKNPSRYYGNCPCGESYAMLNPEGGLYFCPVNKDMIAGNVRENKFDSIWTGEKAGEIRKFFNRRVCHCWLSCTNSSMMADNFFKYKSEIEKKYAS